MSRAAILGALAIGTIGAGLIYLARGAGSSAKPVPDWGDWNGDRLAALNWQRPDDSFVFADYSAPTNPATVADATGIFQGENGMGLGSFLKDLFSGGGMMAGPDPATPGPTAGRGNAAPLLDLIGSLEGPKGYSDYYRGAKIPPPRPLENMTVGEVMAWQQRNKDVRSNSAAGRYQIINKTLGGLVGQGVLSLDEPFNARAQDRAAIALADRRGLTRYRAGQISEQQFAQNLAMEWAAFPAATRDRRGRPAQGQSYYAGDGLNKSLTTLDRVLATIRSI